MDIDKVKEFIKYAKDQGLYEIKYEEKDLKIEAVFKKEAIVAQGQITPQYLAPSVSTEIHKEEKPKVVKDNFHEVKSPFVGTYYSSPSPGKPTFVKIGDRVKKGQVLCILEAMKIMNEIESDKDGEIVEICADNESLVEYGQTLFKIK